MVENSWVRSWDTIVGLVGQEVTFGPFIGAKGIEDVERSSIRRFCEPMEFDCPLHYDDEIAVAHGYRGVVAPVSSVSQTFVDRGLWRPGVPGIYESRDAHARPGTGVGSAPSWWDPEGPDVSAAIITDIEIEYCTDVYVADRLEMRSNILVSCVPKETSLGRGAFITLENSCYNQRDLRVATVRRGLYVYSPRKGV